MTPQLNTLIFPVHDLAAAKAFYTALLGTEPAWDQPYYVGYEVGGQHLGLDPNGHAQGHTSGVGYWSVDDIEAAVAALTEAGGEVRQSPRDVGGRLIALVTDADGNVTGLMQDLH